MKSMLSECGAHEWRKTVKCSKKVQKQLVRMLCDVKGVTYEK